MLPRFSNQSPWAEFQLILRASIHGDFSVYHTFDNNLCSNKTTNLTSTHVFPGLAPNRTLRLSTIPKHFKYATNFSPRQTLVMTSAISGSPAADNSMVGEDTASVLDTVKVFDLNGNAIPIFDLWKDRKAVDIMDASGVALVVIGPGSIDQQCQCHACCCKAAYIVERPYYSSKLGCKRMREMSSILEVYADLTHSSYEALQFVSGVSTTFTSKVTGLKIIQLYMEGYRQDWKLSFEKDTVTRGGWQLGGIIVAGPGKNNISYVHKDKEAGDDPDIKDILKACCS
ncbi:hypothetical protein I3760_09G183100 [Carya illinoinensis]|nr:hypothetical protein I3760_09G183100 [Carya illinoinensis]